MGIVLEEVGHVVDGVVVLGSVVGCGSPRETKKPGIVPGSSEGEF
jgi:hypothetical protein